MATAKDGGGAECDGDSPNANHAYEAKFQDMQKYIPFLERMIQKLKRASGGTRATQLAKMKSLYSILIDGKHRLTLESLEKCDTILRNLYQKVSGEGFDILQQSLSPRATPTKATKAKENEPNPNRIFASKKPPPGFKKNFKKQRLAGLPENVGTEAQPTEKRVEVPKRVTKVSCKISDLKSGKIKTNVKHGNKASITAVNPTSSKIELRNNDHNKSVVNTSETQPRTGEDQNEVIENSSVTQPHTIGSKQDKTLANLPLAKHQSTMNFNKKNVVSSSVTLQSGTNSDVNKQKGKSKVTKPLTSNSEKKKLVDSSTVKQDSTSKSDQDKRVSENKTVTKQSTSELDCKQVESVGSFDNSHQNLSSNSASQTSVHTIKLQSSSAINSPATKPDELSKTKNLTILSENKLENRMHSSDDNVVHSTTTQFDQLKRPLPSPKDPRLARSLLARSALNESLKQPTNLLQVNDASKIDPKQSQNVRAKPAEEAPTVHKVGSSVGNTCKSEPSPSQSLRAKLTEDITTVHKFGSSIGNTCISEPSPSQSLRAKLAEDITTVHRVGSSVGNTSKTEPSPSQSLRAKLAEDITTVHKVSSSVGNTCKTEPSPSQSLRAKLAEDITTVHKVGTSVGGALRTLTKNLSSIEQNRIANLKPGTIIDLMEKELPKTNKKSVKKESNQFSDQIIKTNESSNSIQNPSLSSLSKEELEELVVKNIRNLPTVPADTIQILERINNSSTQINPINYPGSLSSPANSDQASNIFESTGELHIEVEENSSSSTNSAQALKRFDSTQVHSRTGEFFSRVEGSLCNSANRDHTANRIDSNKNSRTCEFYIKEEENSEQISNRFESYQSSRSSEFYDRAENPAGNYSNWEHRPYDSIPSPFRIQSPNYTQSNFARDTSFGNNPYYSRNIDLSPLYDQSQNDNFSSYGMGYYNRDPRRRSLDQAECSPESDDWQRVVTIPDDRSQHKPYYFTGNDSNWSDDNSRFSSRYHRGNMVQNSPYRRTHMTNRSNSVVSSARRTSDRFSPERTSRRSSNLRSSLDYPEERRLLDPNRRVSDARVKRFRDYESYPERSVFELDQHERTHSTYFRSLHDTPINTPTVDRHSFSDRSRLSQERVYSDRTVSDNRATDSRNTSITSSNTRRDTFSSPLDQLYSETRGPITGKGYGVQNFRTRRIKSKESDHTSKRKCFDKSTTKNIEEEDNTKSSEQSISKNNENEDDNLKQIEQNAQNKDAPHRTEECALSEEKKTDSTILQKTLVCNQDLTEESPIDVIDLIEERNVVILLEKPDLENSKEPEKKSSTSDHDSNDLKQETSDVMSSKEKGKPVNPVDSEKHEVGSGEKSKCQRSIQNDKLLEDTDGSSENNQEVKEKLTAKNLSDSSKLEIPDCKVDETTISEVSGNENIMVETKASESQNSGTQEGSFRVDNETTQNSKNPSKETENVSNYDTEKSESVEIVHNEIAKSNSDDQINQNQASKEKELPLIGSTAIENASSNRNSDDNSPLFESITLEKSNDHSIEADSTNECKETIKNEPLNDGEGSKIEDRCSTESNNSCSGQFNRTNSNMVGIFEALMKNSLQIEESKRLLAKLNSEKLKKIQQILDSSDEEPDAQEDSKLFVSVGTSLENDQSKRNEHVINDNKDTETSSKKNIDTTSNNDFKSVNTTTDQTTNLTENSEQCNINKKNNSPAKKIGRNLKSRSNNNKKPTSESVESSQEFEKGKKKKAKLSELDKLHDGLREMFLKAEIEKSTGIRSCRLRNLNATVPKNVDKSPDASNRKKLLKEKTKDNLDIITNDGGKDLSNTERIKDSLEGEGSVEADKPDCKTSNESSIVEPKADEVDNEGEDNQPNANKSTSKDKDRVETHNFSKDNSLKNVDKLKAEDNLIKSVLMSGGSNNLTSYVKSTAIVLMQKSNALMKSQKALSMENSESNLVEKSDINEKQDQVIQPSCTSQVPDKASVETSNLSVPRKSMKNKDVQQVPDNDQSVVDKSQSVDIDKNPSILLDNRSNCHSVESLCQTATDMQISSNNDNISTDSAIQSDTSKGSPVEMSHSEPDIEGITHRKRLQSEYSELSNIFTDKTYFQKDSAVKAQQFLCKICNFFGKAIVKHYVTEHSDQDVLISRLEASDAKEAIRKSENGEVSIKPSSFKCYMCFRTCTNFVSFYDHITSHTGEYRYRCQLCNYKSANRDAIKLHCTSLHSLDWKTNSKTAVVIDTIYDSKNVFGYICSECYFVQLKLSTVEEHVKNHHGVTSEAMVIRINMSSLESSAVDSDKILDSLDDMIKILGNRHDDSVAVNKDVQETVPENRVINDDLDEILQEKSFENAIHTQEGNESVGAFSCTEPMNDVDEKRSIMKTTMGNIEETVFNKEQNETIVCKLDELSDSLEISSDDEPVTFGTENVPQDESVNEFADGLVTVNPRNGDQNELGQDLLLFAEDHVVYEGDIHAEDETIFADEIKLENTDFETTDSVIIEIEDSSDESVKLSKVSSLIDTVPHKSEDNEEQNADANDDCVDDDFGNDGIRSNENDILNSISNEDLSTVNVGPLTISRSNENVTFSCNIGLCEFTTNDHSYIVCHFGLHMISNTKLNCSGCDEEFDPILPTVELMKGLLKHGLEHLFPPPPPPPPTPPPLPPAKAPQDTEKGTEVPRIRVRRLSGDQLSTFANEDVSHNVAVPSCSYASISNDSLGNLRIESVVSAANCDAETLQALNLLHPNDQESNRKRPRLETPPQHFQEKLNVAESIKVEFLINFYKCMGRNCGFSTNDLTAFKAHFKTAHSRKKKDGFWNKCAYCPTEEWGLISRLFTHISNTHYYSKYQCAYCLYRAYQKSHVVFHQQSVHPDRVLRIYFCEINVMPDPGPNFRLPKKKDVIPVFGCTSDGPCKMMCLLWEQYMSHVESHNGNCRTCHMCYRWFPMQSVNQLFQHYMTHHKIGLHQCLYCIHGENTTEDMRRHLFEKHADWPAQAIMRKIKASEISKVNVMFESAEELEINLESLEVIDYDDKIVPEEAIIYCGPTAEDAQLPRATQLSNPFTKTQQFSQEERPSQSSNETISMTMEQPHSSSFRLASTSRLVAVQPPLHLPRLPIANRNTSSISPKITTIRTLMKHNQQLTNKVSGNQAEAQSFAQSKNGIETSSGLSTEVISLLSSDTEFDAKEESKTLSSAQSKNTSSLKTSSGRVISLSSSDSEDAREDELYLCFLCDRTEMKYYKIINHVVAVHRVKKTKIINMIDTGGNIKKKVVRSEVVICNNHTKIHLDLKTKFSMHEVELLPNRAVLNSPIYCDHCEFSNVVVKNMKIHLQNHASGKEVSTTLLVNPVPCLEKNEKMFDKMVNLAGSSHSQPVKIPELIDFVAPKYVEQSARFACSVCKYTSLDAAMLLSHLKSLHYEVFLYQCPHCTNVAVPINKIGHHLTMHGTRMYRCIHCTYHHYQRHVVGKHLSEKHPEKKQFVHIVRDPDDDGSKSLDEDEMGAKSIKVWQCSFCDMFKNKEIQIKKHCNDLHKISHRYKCCFCKSTSDTEEEIYLHFKNEHPGNDVHIVTVYDRVCIYSPFPQYNVSYDVGLQWRREKNLRDNIRGITFTESLKASTSRPDNFQNLTQYMCPTCKVFTCKTKKELTDHLWKEFKCIAEPSVQKGEDNLKNMSAWISVVTEQQEQKILEYQASLVDNTEAKEKETSTETRPKMLYRKRSISNRNKNANVSTPTTTDSSDDASEHKKPKRAKTAKHRYKCGYCDYRSFMIKIMKKHLENKHPGQEELINTINEKSSETEDKRLYECQLCGRQDRRGALLDHFSNTHPSSEVKMSLIEGQVFSCNYCGNIETTRDRLINHSLKEHPFMAIDVSIEFQTTVEAEPQQESFPCPVCNEKHLSQELMFDCVRRHMYYKCDFCNAAFNARNACRLHINKVHALLVDSVVDKHICTAYSTVFPDASPSSSLPYSVEPGGTAVPGDNAIAKRISWASKPSAVAKKAVAVKSTAVVKKAVVKKSTAVVKKAVAKKSTAKSRPIPKDATNPNEQLIISQPKVVLSDLRNSYEK